MKAIDSSSRIFVAGHLGMVGRAIVRALEARGYTNLVLRSRKELDLLNQSQVDGFFRAERIDAVYLAAAKVGGIHANSTEPAEFLYENLMIASNVIHAAFQAKVEKLLFLGSSCIYPKLAPQPIREESLLTSPLEPTNEAYAIAKIAGLKLCEYYAREHGRRFISAMPTNLYGSFDHFDALKSHVIPGLLGRMHRAKLARDPEFPVWGTGKPRREFLHVDDLAEALVLLMDRHEAPEWVNVGTGEDLEIGELAKLLARVTGYAGRIAFDPSKPDGTPRKVLDVTRMKSLGWSPRISLEKGLRETYEWALANRPADFPTRSSASI